MGWTFGKARPATSVGLTIFTIVRFEYSLSCQFGVMIGNDGAGSHLLGDPLAHFGPRFVLRLVIPESGALVLYRLSNLLLRSLDHVAAIVRDLFTRQDFLEFRVAG